MTDKQDGRPEQAILPRAGVDLLVNVISLLAFAGLAITGLFFMEGDHGPARGLHELFGYLMVGLVAVHLVRHRRWIAAATAGRSFGDAASRKRTWAAVALATFALVAISAGSLFFGDRDGDGHGHGPRRRPPHEGR